MRPAVGSTHHLKWSALRGWLFERPNPETTATVLSVCDSGPWVQMPDGSKINPTWQEWEQMLGGETCQL